MIVFSFAIRLDDSLLDIIFLGILFNLRPLHYGTHTGTARRKAPVDIIH
jgi:hypothetical protein